eukprot:8736124-Pyramimonas_sp.AAC.1
MATSGSAGIAGGSGALDRPPVVPRDWKQAALLLVVGMDGAAAGGAAQAVARTTNQLTRARMACGDAAAVARVPRLPAVPARREPQQDPQESG